MSTSKKPPSGNWSTAAKGYAANVGQSSFKAASRLIEMAHSLDPITSTSYILDNGAGTGAVTRVVAAQYPEARILATDLSEQMLSVLDAEHIPNVKTKVLDATLLREDKELEPASFSHVFSTFMLQVIMDPLDAVRQIHEVLRPNGVIGLAVWAPEQGVYELWTKACQSIDPSYKMPWPFEDPKAWRTEEDLRGAFGKTGFTDLTFDYCRMAFPFDSPEAYTRFWFGGKNPGATGVIDAYQGDLGPVKTAMEKVVREQYGNGKDIWLAGTLGVGRKEG